MKDRLLLGGIVVSCLAVVVGLTFQPAQAHFASGQPEGAGHSGLPGGYKHLVVIYEENHSFDNLYGSWGKVNGQSVDGSHTAVTQRDQSGRALTCLPQNDVNLVAKGLPNVAACASGKTTPVQPFKINDYISPSDKTCALNGATVFPAQAHGVLPTDSNATAGGCTEDIVHRFYPEQYDIDGGKMDHYVVGEDAIGLSLGYYDTTQLPIYKYLHNDPAYVAKGQKAPNYVIADHFFQAAFGGSFLNHQFLIAARAPLDTDPDYGTAPATNAAPAADGSSVTGATYPLLSGLGVDGQLTKKCAAPESNDRLLACGNFAVNTIQPANAPHAGGATLPLIDDQDYPNIGDELTGAGVSWGWFSGGWDLANAGTPTNAFQYHHQPFNYFNNYAPGQPGRVHLQDENNFFTDTAAGNLPTVSFVKPVGVDNEHPGYASETSGSDHLVKLVKAIENGPEGKDTLIVVTYDEFGGQYDHVPPPGKGSPTKGVYDAWGPGTRVPAMLISESLPTSGVDHTEYDTTSILATIEHSFGLSPLSTRDAKVNDLSHAVSVGRGRK